LKRKVLESHSLVVTLNENEASDLMFNSTRENVSILSKKREKEGERERGM